MSLQLQERSGNLPLDSGVDPPCTRYRDPLEGTPLNRCGTRAYWAHCLKPGLRHAIFSLGQGKRPTKPRIYSRNAAD